MFDKIKRLGTDTAIYGISTIIGRSLNFLLVPFYTNVLDPGKYGLVAYVYSIIAFITVIYNYGLESAYFKYSSSLEEGNPKQNFSTPFVALVFTTIIFTIFIVLFTGPIEGLLNLSSNFTMPIYLTAGMLAFDTLSLVPFASLRMERKAKTFALIKFINIFITVVLNIVLLVVFGMGVTGIFISGFIASVFTFLLLVPTVWKHFTISFNKHLLYSLLKFGLPFIPSGLAAQAIQVIDRPILRSLTDDATVGIYQANYRLGIFMMLVVQMFDYAWRPFYFSMEKDPDARSIFARVLTYFVLVMSTLFIIVSLFINDLVKVRIFGHSFIHPDYWSGLNIIPIVLLGYMFLGVSNNLSAGIFIKKKTHLMPVVTITGAAVNIIANYLLIPVMGITGAALATFLAYFVMAIILYQMSKRIYPIPYELGRLAKIALATAAIMLVYYYVPFTINPLIIKCCLTIAFLILMYLLKFFSENEINLILNLFRKGTKSIPVNGATRKDDDNLGV
ncbi:MAG: oligosaccharide flippase family protein [Bacteroidota bacterium]